jgi:hypothetical protein
MAIMLHGGGGAGNFLHSKLHEAADFELDGALGGDRHAFHGFGILGDSRCALFAFKHAKVPEFEAIAPAQFGDDFVEKALGHALYDDTFDPQLLGDPINEFFFGYRRHACPFLPPSRVYELVPGFVLRRCHAG